MKDRRIDVFFYGLFMDAGALRAKGLHPENARLACVPGFGLRIGQRATLVADPSSCVYGFLIELSHAEIDQLYSEPSVRAYRAEAVIAKLANGSRVPALCFNLLTPPGSEETNLEYAAKLRDLARQLGLPAGYIQDIR